MFPSDEQFGKWVGASQLATHADGREIIRDDRAAAMWAAANPSEFAEARAAGNARTVRGIYAKWNEINVLRAVRQTYRQIGRSKIPRG